MESSNPFLGVLLHWMGGLAAASFYVSFSRVRHWSWETYWLVGGVFSWIVAPWLLGLAFTSDLAGVILRAPPDVLFWSGLFGFLWGVGGLMFGLTMRYLGISLGYGVALGICAVCGTLIPPIFKGTLTGIAASAAGRTTLIGIGVCVLGIAIAALAGLSKEHELTDDTKRASIKEFNLRKGLATAIICGVLSSCMAFALEAAGPLAKLSADAGTATLWTGLPKLVVVLAGGFASNAIWCVAILARRKSAREFMSPRTTEGSDVPRLANLLFCGLAGVTWYLQFFFYTMGETQMGAFAFSSWTLHMASIIIFSTIWGVAFKEWRGTSRRTHALIAIGIGTLIVATLIVGYGNLLALR